ncbi:MAG: type II toxin-antitoxin system YoeB family toxin [Symploca sp. SIO2C1]|nr:type II toxin-antitoxin system YoeB family toxin [Symploca sp. SIO2C1]
MKAITSNQAKQQLDELNDKKLLKRVNLLVRDIIRNSFDGIGKPEPMKANLSMDN